MKFVIIISSILFVPTFLFSGTFGKINGKITAKETGTPLARVNVAIVGTTYGAVTDVNGNYVILNVPAGIHSLRANFSGYQEVTINNIRVNIDLTRNVNFELPSEAIKASKVEILDEQPLIYTNATNSVSILTSEKIQYKPLRGYRSLVALAPGAVSDDNGNTYVRGGRIEETAYYIDGVYQNNLRFGTPIGNLSAYAIEEVSVQAGGFNAEYGFASSGIVNATTKTGGLHFNIFGEFITDGWLSQSNKKLGTFSYGYNVANLAISGPLPLFNDRIRFFASFERNYLDDATPSSGVHPVLIEDRSPIEEGVPEPKDIDIAEGREGPIPNNDLGRSIANANITFDLAPLRLKIGGNMTQEKWDEALIWNMLSNSAHNPRIENFSRSLYLQGMYSMGSNTAINGQVNYFEDGNEIYDPVLKRDIVNYGDKTDYNNDGVFNPALVNDGVNIRYEESTAKLFAPSGRIYNNFALNRSSYIGGKLDFAYQIEHIHEIKLGIELRRHMLKRYRTRPFYLATQFVNNPDIDPILAYAGTYTDAYGYEFVQDPGPNGDLIEGGLTKYDQAKHPIISAIYLQDKIEASDLVMNLGVRFDYFDANGYIVDDPLNIQITSDGLFERSQLRKSKTHITVSPRFGVAIPISDHSVIYGQYGKFTQQPPYELLFKGWELFANEILFGSGLSPQNADLAPVKTTAYEVGFRQQFGNFAALDFAAYYKQISDMVRLERLENALPKQYYRFINGDYGTVKGISMNVHISDKSRLTANLAYTYQFAGGTGSSAWSNEFIEFFTAGGEDGYPTYVASTEFDQRHTGRISVNLHSRDDDGPTIFGIKPLANFDISMLFSFGSGFPYTSTTVGDPLIATTRTIVPREVINSSHGPWQTQLDLLINRSFIWGGVTFDVYLWGINVLGTQNWNTRTIYGGTGDNADPGYLDSADGKNWVVENGGEPAANLYRLRTNAPSHWSTPRQLRLGLRFNLGP